MSQKYSGGFITKSPVAPTSSAASGIWTLDQQQQAQQAGNWPSPPMFIEDLFSTYLYTGNSSTQTITNGIDLSGQGGLVWRQGRSAATGGMLIDTSRGIGSYLISYSTDAAQTGSNWIDSFNSNGFTMNSSSFNGGATYASWTFRKQPKFFDIVTYTGDSTNGRAISHSLGSTPGFIIVKSTSDAAQWVCWSRGFNSGNGYGYLNDTTAWFTSGEDVWGNGTSYIAPTSTTFTVKGGSLSNLSGRTYVAYLFAHDAGGFPVSGGGSTNGISCGSWTGTGLTFTVNLGYEPQWLMFKRTDDVGDWIIIDNMRGVTVDGADAYLRPNTSGAEANITGGATLNSTGFSWATGVGSTFIYIAIRRGPMKTPTVGTSVFSPNAYTGGTAGTSFNLGFVPDTLLTMRRNTSNFNILQSRLTGLQYMFTYSTAAETTASSGMPTWDANTGTTKLATATAVTGWNASGSTYVNEAFARAPGFMDVVCYTGTGSTQAITHNLGVTPELIIIKNRTGVYDWLVYSATTGTLNTLYMNLTNAVTAYTVVSSPAATAFVANGVANSNTDTFVAYLFATLAGVSKVGSYTGNGSSQTIACGFTAGSRFVLIKRTDSTGDWYVWDSARGIVAGNDPHLSLNTSAAEVTTDDSVDTDNSGFIVNQDAATNVNVTSATYIFLAIA